MFHVSALRSFVGVNNIPLGGYTTLCIHSRVDGLFFFSSYLLALMKSAVMNIHVQVLSERLISNLGVPI